MPVKICHKTHMSMRCLYMSMKTNPSSTASALWIKRCTCPCAVSTKITGGGSNLQLSMYKLHKQSSTIDFSSKGNEIHTYVTVKEQIEDKVFNILYTLSHNIHNNRGAALSTSEIYTYPYK